MTDKEYQQYKAYEDQVFQKGLKIIAICGGILYAALISFMLFWPQETWTQADKTSTAYIAMLIVFLPFFGFIFFIQGHTLWSMDRWSRRRK